MIASIPSGYTSVTSKAKTQRIILTPAICSARAAYLKHEKLKRIALSDIYYLVIGVDPVKNDINWVENGYPEQ